MSKPITPRQLLGAVTASMILIGTLNFSQPVGASDSSADQPGVPDTQTGDPPLPHTSNFVALDLDPQLLETSNAVPTVELTEPEQEAVTVSVSDELSGHALASGDETSRPASTKVEHIGDSASPHWFVEVDATAELGDKAALPGGESVADFEDKLTDLDPYIGVVRSGRPSAEFEGLCEYDGYIQLRGEPRSSIEVRELAFDPDACLALTAVGYGERVDEVPTVDETSHGTGRNQASNGYTAYTRTQVREPAYGILDATSEVWAITMVHANDPCDSRNSNTHESSHLTASGWFRVSYVPDSSDSNCTRTQMKVHAHFRNETVCHVTHNAHHWPTVVEGHRNNLSNHPNNTTNDGFCAFALRNNTTIDLTPM